MGGLIILIGLIAGMVIGWHPENAFTLGLVLWYAAIGYVDDFLVPRLFPGKRGLGWMQKLILEVVPFAFLWIMSPNTPFWVIGLTAFVVLFFANAYNFTDGMDGLAGGVGLVLSLTLAILVAVQGPYERAVPYGPLAMVLAASILPFLFYNAPPAKVFMGDVGSLPIGAALGMVFLQTTLFGPRGSVYWPAALWAAPMLVVLLAELVPVPLQIASAKLRKGKRLFSFKTPVHHGFQAAGWPESRVVWMFILVQIASSFLTIGIFVWQVWKW